VVNGLIRQMAALVRRALTGICTVPTLLVLFYFYFAWEGSGGVMVMTLDSRLKRSLFDSRPFGFQVTTLGKLFTHNVPLSPISVNWYRSEVDDALWLGR